MSSGLPLGGFRKLVARLLLLRSFLVLCVPVGGCSLIFLSGLFSIAVGGRAGSRSLFGALWLVAWLFAVDKSSGSKSVDFQGLSAAFYGSG